MTWWLGLLIGLVLGVPFGLLLGTLLTANGADRDAEDRQRDPSPAARSVDLLVPAGVEHSRLRRGADP